jgi:hypothetical protein
MVCLQARLPFTELMLTTVLGPVATTPR